MEHARKHSSVTFISPPRSRSPSEGEDTIRSSAVPPMPTWNHFDIPNPSTQKATKYPPVPKAPCSNKITLPIINCPPIQRPPICPIQITIQHDVPAGSCRRYDTVERETNTVSQTLKGKTTILCSEGYEKRSKYVTRKDSNGITHTYCKETETKNNLAEGSSSRTVQPIVENGQPFGPLAKPKPNSFAGKLLEGNTKSVRKENDFETKKSMWE